MTNDQLDDEIKHLIVDTLMLEDVTPEEIEVEAPLFGDGLGLDSIDALELALALHKKFGVKTSPDDERNREYFYSVKSLREFVLAQRSESKSA